MSETIRPFRSPTWNYKIRKITKSNKTGDAFGINIPHVIAQQFKGVNFSMFITNTSIILESGCKVEKRGGYIERENKVVSSF